MAYQDVIDLARRQLWLVTRSQLLALGWTDQRIGRAVQSGRWRRLQPAVFLVAPSDPSWLQREQAAILSAERAFGSYLAAAHLHQIDGWGRRPPAPEITVEYGKRSMAQATRVHRTRRWPDTDLVVVQGITATNVLRTLADCAAIVGDLTAWQYVEAAFRRRKATPSSLASFIEGRGAPLRGTRRLERILARRAGEVDSNGEIRFLQCLAAAGVRPPETQFEIALRDGSRAVVDFCWAPERVVIEWDSPDAHDPAHLDYDLGRQNSIMAAGYTVRRYTPAMASAHPMDIALEVKALLAESTPAAAA